MVVIWGAVVVPEELAEVCARDWERGSSVPDSGPGTRSDSRPPKGFVIGTLVDVTDTIFVGARVVFGAGISPPTSDNTPLRGFGSEVVKD